MNEKIDLSIIILNFNTRELLRNCLSSITDNKVSWEIIVVDNASTDGSIQMIKKEFPWVRIIKSIVNIGYAAGNNKGIKEAKGRYVLLLNSDTVVVGATLSKLIAFMEAHKDTGVATARVELASGKLDPACHRGFPTPWAAFTYFAGLERLFPQTKLFGQYHLGYLGYTSVHEIDSPSGAFYLIRKEAIDQVGYLDEDYFMYGEDLDWSYRIKKAGWKVMFVPDGRVIHLKKKSGRDSDNPMLRQKITDSFYGTMKIFYTKHYLEKYPRWITRLILFGVDSRKKFI